MSFGKYILFVGIGVAAMAAGEFQTAVTQGHPIYFPMAVGLYIVLISIMYWIGKLIDKITGTRADLIYFFIAGVVGLIIEWGVLGNGPWGNNPGALDGGMFAWWAVVFTLPRLFIAEKDDLIKRARRKAMITLIIYSIVSTIIVFAILATGIAGPIAGLMFTISHLLICFQMAPFIARNGGARGLRIFLWFLVIVTVLDLLQW